MLRAVGACVRASSASVCAAALLLLIASNSDVALAANGVGGVSSVMPVDGKTLIVRLRSFAPRASGRLLLEPTTGGGRARLTATNLPPARALAPNARAFVAWASGGRIIRLGELRRDSRGGGSLVFPHPAEFTRYSLIVTAETDARAERPSGAPVFSTRANEVAALFPSPPANDAARAATTRRDRRATTRSPRPAAPVSTPNSTRGTTTSSSSSSSSAANETNASPRAANAATTTALRTRGRVRAGGAEGEFFTNVDEAIKRDATARTLVLVGDRGARRARGTARVTTLEDGTAYVRVRFRRVPSPTRFGRGRRYTMWALIPEDGTVYMGTLPARDINRRQTYARTEGVNSDKFRLLVTAERRTPAPRPTGRRVLMTFKGRRRK
ncbi:MAG: hypothetical protein LC803_15310 [Acidobacteria bacterium]|nr:hypothetical protein [Acidobacteriota bacterium]